MARMVLDAKGLQCPLPVLRASKMLRTMEAGDILEIHATDPAAPKDFTAFCEATRNRLLANRNDAGTSAGTQAGTFVIEIEKV